MYLHVHCFLGMFQTYLTTKWMRGILSMTNLYSPNAYFCGILHQLYIVDTTTQHPILHIQYTPEIQHRYQKLPCLKGATFSKPSLWVSMLVFGRVIVLDVLYVYLTMNAYLLR